MREEGWVGWEYYPTTGPDNDRLDGETGVSRLGARVVITVKDAYVVWCDYNGGAILIVNPV